MLQAPVPGLFSRQIFVALDRDNVTEKEIVVNTRAVTSLTENKLQNRCRKNRLVARKETGETEESG